MLTPDQLPEMVAHHEAGHAVATVTRGGYVDEIRLGDTDPHDPELVWSWVRVEIPLHDHAFAVFAGPWTTARWEIETDPDIDDDAALIAAFLNAEDDAAKYDRLVERFGPVDEDAFGDELECLWPAIQDVAAMLLAGETVTHDAVVAAIAALGLDNEAGVA